LGITSWWHCFVQAKAPRETNSIENQVKAVERQVPEAHVVRIAHANHYVFVSNEQDVLREMNSFISKLPQSSRWMRAGRLYPMVTCQFVPPEYQSTAR
jgi:hypothetical protein